MISTELAHTLARLSQEINRQIGLLVTRKGEVVQIMVGTSQGLVIPDLGVWRGGGGRLRGLRFLHTHFKGVPLNQEDLMDLTFLRLDLITALALRPDGQVREVYSAHLLPVSREGQGWEVLKPETLGQFGLDPEALVRSLEEEFARTIRVRTLDQGKERAILVSVSEGPRQAAEDSLDELSELARSAGLAVVDTVLQIQRGRISPRFLMGKGKIGELLIRALQTGAGILVFDQDLTFSQVRSITDFTELKVIDRTQLILDIFSQRAKTQEGKIQVEMAQLKYLMPRLGVKDDALSRLTGGIGGRGPGETKLEVDKRRVRDRLARLKQDLGGISRQRQLRRVKRDKQGLPILSIIGYTNAGKSTLLNTLTKSRILSEDRLFATLDPTTRRLKFPRERQVIITDTVGFIRNLPKDLLEAFRATLEELESANLLLHVVDLANPHFEDQMQVVEDLLVELGLIHIPMLRVFNKMDKVPREEAQRKCARYGAVGISALDENTLDPLIRKIETFLDHPPAVWGKAALT